MLRRVEAALATSQLTQDQALALLHELFDGFMATLLSADSPELWTRFVFRELMEPSSVFEILNQQVVQKTIRPCAGLIARVLDKPSDDPECVVRAFSLFGQVLIFRTVREVTLKTLGWEDFSGDRLELIRTVIQLQVKGALENSLTSAPEATCSEKSHPTA
ncbi:MAG: DUF1956 domain-containing protein [Cyanobacteria bacterium Co-bin13]|nr:DUF1956 domain-containing protein [Cyanobacteria bacterium Co-bin13]